MPKRKRRYYPTQYPTDLTDAQWAMIEPIVTAAAPQGGRPPEIDLRAIVNALIYKNRTGCPWRLIPADFPPMGAVRSYVDTWNMDGTCIKLNDHLRKAARKALGRDEEPSISVIDAQSTKTTEVGGDRGFDGGKKVHGRKRQLWVDTNGLLLRILVHPADSSDTEGAEWLIRDHHHCFPRLREVRVDTGYKSRLATWMNKNTTMHMNGIEKPIGQKGFAVIPRA